MAVDLTELQQMIETALPGAEVEVSDEDGAGHAEEEHDFKNVHCKNAESHRLDCIPVLKRFHGNKRIQSVELRVRRSFRGGSALLD